MNSMRLTIITTTLLKIRNVTVLKLEKNNHIKIVYRNLS